MKRIETALSGVFLVEPKVFRDDRGFFLESYNQAALNGLGITCPFVQDNHSRSQHGVLRGIHYQIRRPQAKLIRVLRGEVFDVVVDLRRGSPTFGRWISQVLSEEDPRMLFIPEGCGHGFYVMSPSADFFYKCSDFYSPPDERGIAWNDPALRIEWPLRGVPPVVSSRDQAWKPLAEVAPADLP